MPPLSNTRAGDRLSQSFLRYRGAVRTLPPKLSTRVLVRRLAKNGAIVGGLVAAALAIGAFGYHYLDGLSWLDATLNAAMILTGMGPVDRLVSPGAKIFAIAYALFGGVFFLTMVAVLLAPAVQHFLHRFHLELDEQRGERRDEPGGPPQKRRDGARRA